MTPPAADLFAALDATWPAAEFRTAGPWQVRVGHGGGKRVSAATATTAVTAADIVLAEAAMRAVGQSPLFMVRAGEDALDQMLAARGYGVIDPVVFYCGPSLALCQPPPPLLSTFPVWPPLEIIKEIWASGGIGPERLAIMDRVTGPATAILARTAGRPAGAAFVAIAGNQAMLHALEVVPALRRQGTAVNILRASAAWAQSHGAAWLTLAVTEANEPARNLYASLGMTIVGHYHYRKE